MRECKHMHIGEDARLLISVFDDQETFYADDNPIALVPNNKLLIRVIDEADPRSESCFDIILTKKQLKPILKVMKKRLKELT